MRPTIWGLYHNKERPYIKDYLRGFERQKCKVRAFEKPADFPEGEKPDFVLDFNFHLGCLGTAGRMGVPYVSIVYDLWFDDPEAVYGLVMKGTEGRPISEFGQAYVFTCCPNQVTTWGRMGAYAEYLPLGVNTERFKPLGRKHERRIEACFVGGHLTGQRFDGWLNTLEWIKKEKPPKGREIEKIVMGSMLTQLEEGIFEWKLPEIVSERERKHGFLLHDDSVKRNTLILHISNHVCMLQRKRVIERLTTRDKVCLRVWGPEGWEVPLPGKYMGPAEYEGNLPAIYGDSVVAVNINKLPSWNALGPRMYEAMACGACVVSGPNAAMSQRFMPGRQYYEAKTLAEFGARVRNLVDTPALAEEAGWWGMKKVRGHDDVRHRARHILNRLELLRGPF